MKLELYKEIRTYIKSLIAGTEFEGKTYCVGGCCRDEVLGNDIKDIDIVVELEDGGIKLAKYLFSNHFTKGGVQCYERFGTAMFRLRRYPDIEIEVVHTRCEKYLNGESRNPETDYGTIVEDCYRRDLTINALYYNISTDEFKDICGYSIDHIKNHLICTPSNPDITYVDDPLRILRCVRFATRYNWKIENQTFLSLKKNVERLKIISAERITNEFLQILNSKNYIYGLALLEKIGALDYILTPFNCHNNLFKKEFYQLNLPMMSSTLLDNENVKLAVLLYDYSQYAEQILRIRKFPNIQIKYIDSLIKLVKFYVTIFELYKNNYARIRECQYKCKTKEKFDDFLKVLFTIDPTLYESLKDINYKDCNHFGYTLPVDGDDVMEIAKIGPSSDVKRILDILLAESFMNPYITKDECIEFIKCLYKIEGD